MSALQPVIRHARPDEQRLIRQMVRAVGLDPTNLKWQNFVVAELDREVVGIGQIRRSPSCHELGSLVVKPAYRGQGLARLIIEALLAEESGDVYLECESSRVPIYRRFGFEEIRWQDAPMPLKLKAGFGNSIGRLAGWRIAVMVRRSVL